MICSVPFPVPLQDDVLKSSSITRYRVLVKTWSQIPYHASMWPLSSSLSLRPLCLYAHARYFHAFCWDLEMPLYNFTNVFLKPLYNLLVICGITSTTILLVSRWMLMKQHHHDCNNFIKDDKIEFHFEQSAWALRCGNHHLDVFAMLGTPLGISIYASTLLWYRYRIEDIFINNMVAKSLEPI